MGLSRLSLMMLKIVLSLFLLNISVGYANSNLTKWFSQDTQKNVSITVDLFVSSTCPHCHKADAFFRDLEKKEPWLIVHRYVINQDKPALQTFYEHLQQQHSSNFSVPAIFFCDSLWAGFADETTTGKMLLRAISYCRKQIIQQGELSPATVNALQKWGAASQVQIGPNISQSALSLVPLTALSDGFNPCSLFCLAAFFAFIWIYPERKWRQFSIGAVFIVSLGVIHYLQQVHSGFFYQYIFKWRVAAILAGALLIITVFRGYRKIGELKNLTAFAWILVVTAPTVFVLHVYQQTCPFNLALVLEQWLTDQALSPEVRHFYQIVYQVFYLLPLITLLLFFLLFGQHYWIARYQQTLKAAAYLILTSIGIILLAYPIWLANVWISAIVFFGAIGAGWGWRRYEQIK